MNNIDCFETDFVYTTDNTNEFKNVHISFRLKNEGFLLEILSDEELNKSEVEEILNQLNDSYFKRLRISVSSECKITLNIKGKKQNVDVIDNGIVVKNIIPAED